jgi:hypothetical protein
MSLSRTMMNEIKNPTIFDYIYVSIISSIVSICFHLALNFFFENVLKFVIHFIINVLLGCARFLYMVFVVLLQAFCHFASLCKRTKKRKRTSGRQTNKMSKKYREFKMMRS